MLEDETDPLEMLLNPELHEIEVTYFLFFAYDAVSWHIDEHVGDIERAVITYKNSKPETVTAHYHSNHTTRQYDGVAKMGRRPLLFNARGTHATYFDEGIHGPQLDFVKALDKWDLWKNLDVIFPWDFTKEERIIKTDSDINGLNYLLQVRHYGNKSDDNKHIHYRHPGPVGFVGKFFAHISELGQRDFTCEGMDTDRCPWPVGIFAKQNFLCSPGYAYSYTQGKCFIQSPKHKPTCKRDIKGELLNLG